MNSKRRILGLLAVAFALPFAYARVFEHPSLTRDWSPDQRVLAQASIAADVVTIENVRNFSYRSVSDYDARYERRAYDLNQLDSVWYLVERLPSPGLAHTLLSFGFGDEYLAISVEIRKERGETYSPLRGLLRQYELTYVIADERDVIGLRTNQRRDVVYMYPVRATREQMRRLFVDMVTRANQLAAEPEFYNSLTNNCTSNIVRHVNAIAPRVPFSYKVVLPAYSDELAYDLELIPTDQAFEQVQAAHRIDLLAQQAGVGADFSRMIRSQVALPRK